jgi:hypothetical protein
MRAVGHDVDVADALSVEVLDDAEPLTAAVAVFVDELADALGEASAEPLGPVGEEDESMLAVGVDVVDAEVEGVDEGVVVGVDDDDEDVVGEPDVPLGVDDVGGAAGAVDGLEEGLVAAVEPVLDAAALDVVVPGC